MPILDNILRVSKFGYTAMDASITVLPGENTEDVMLDPVGGWEIWSSDVATSLAPYDIFANIYTYAYGADGATLTPKPPHNWPAGGNPFAHQANAITLGTGAYTLPGTLECKILLPGVLASFLWGWLNSGVTRYSCAIRYRTYNASGQIVDDGIYSGLNNQTFAAMGCPASIYTANPATLFYTITSDLNFIVGAKTDTEVWSSAPITPPLGLPGLSVGGPVTAFGGKGSFGSPAGAEAVDAADGSQAVLKIQAVRAYAGESMPGPVRAQDVGADGLVVLEAEHFNHTVSAKAREWVLVTNPAGFSEDGAMQALPNFGRNVDIDISATHLDFNVQFVQTGIYHVWVRGLAPSPNSEGNDSVNVGLDGALPASSDRITGLPADVYVWSKTTLDRASATFDVASAGLHLVHLWMREDGFIADKILLTLNPDFTPTGVGPAESPIASPPARLEFARSGDQLTLSWVAAGFVLQQNDNLANAAGWADVPNGKISPVTVTIGGGSRFIRLIKR